MGSGRVTKTWRAPTGSRFTFWGSCLLPYSLGILKNPLFDALHSGQWLLFFFFFLAAIWLLSRATISFVFDFLSGQGEQSPFFS